MASASQLPMQLLLRQVETGCWGWGGKDSTASSGPPRPSSWLLLTGAVKPVKPVPVPGPSARASGCRGVSGRAQRCRGMERLHTPRAGGQGGHNPSWPTSQATRSLSQDGRFQLSHSFTWNQAHGRHLPGLLSPLARRAALCFPSSSGRSTCM